MKDGFDKNVAEKMPKIQKVRPNRPWNINPVQMPARADEHIDFSEQTEDLATNQPELTPSLSTVENFIVQTPELITVDRISETPVEIKHAEITLKEIDSQFTNMIIESKESKRIIEKKDTDLQNAIRLNAELKLKISELEANTLQTENLKREVEFLNEQIQDANLYIQGLLSIISEKEQLLAEQMTQKQDIEKRFDKIGTEVRDMAMLDVKAAMLEKDLSAAHLRIKDLEAIVEEEVKKRKPLEDEISELKTTLEKVHSSLAQIRLKAKREAYGL